MTKSVNTTGNRRTPGIRLLSLGLGVAFVALTVAACDQMSSSNMVSPTASVATGATQSKPSNTVPATITFADQVGDKITSNGGSYAAEILSGSTLEFACCAGQIVNYNFSGVISGPGPTGTLSDPSGFFVPNVGSMAVGSTVLTRAYYKTSLGQINFDSSLDALSNSVSVTRVDIHTWTVDTSAGDVGVLVQNQTIPDPNHPHKTITVTTKTYYHLPFRLTGISQ